MISHKYKCIFIHIAKCAGTSVENSFGIDTANFNAEDNDSLFGWDKKNKLWLQHATPQQLLDLQLISTYHWRNYYKFIIYRNSWSRAYSDYLWILRARRTMDSFKNFLNKSGKFQKFLNDKDKGYYAGDHLTLQKDYFFLNGERINYDCEINFENIEAGFSKVIKDLSLKPKFFNKKLKQGPETKKNHYSYFYNTRKKLLVQNLYKEDIEFFDFKFEDKKNLLQKFWGNIKVEDSALQHF